MNNTVYLSDCMMPLCMDYVGVTWSPCVVYMHAMITCLLTHVYKKSIALTLNFGMSSGVSASVICTSKPRYNY